mgnify:CR=1 FL=1
MSTFFTHFGRRLQWAFLIKFYPFYVVAVVVIVAGIVVIFSHFHLLQTTEPISTKFGTMHPLVKKIQVCSNEEPCLISKGSCSSPEKCLLTYRRATVPHIVKTVNILRTKSCARFGLNSVSYTHLRAHETSLHLVCRLLLEKRCVY